MSLQSDGRIFHLLKHFIWKAMMCCMCKKGEAEWYYQWFILLRLLHSVQQLAKLELEECVLRKPQLISQVFFSTTKWKTKQKKLAKQIFFALSTWNVLQHVKRNWKQRRELFCTSVITRYQCIVFQYRLFYSHYFSNQSNYSFHFWKQKIEQDEQVYQYCKTTLFAKLKGQDLMWKWFQQEFSKEIHPFFTQHFSQTVVFVFKKKLEHSPSKLPSLYFSKEFLKVLQRWFLLEHPQLIFSSTTLSSMTNEFLLPFLSHFESTPLYQIPFLFCYSILFCVIFPIYKLSPLQLQHLLQQLLPAILIPNLSYSQFHQQIISFFPFAQTIPGHCLFVYGFSWLYWVLQMNPLQNKEQFFTLEATTSPLPIFGKIETLQRQLSPLPIFPNSSETVYFQRNTRIAFAMQLESLVPIYKLLPTVLESIEIPFIEFSSSNIIDAPDFSSTDIASLYEMIYCYQPTCTYENYFLQLLEMQWYSTPTLLYCKQQLLQHIFSGCFMEPIYFSTTTITVEEEIQIVEWNEKEWNYVVCREEKNIKTEKWTEMEQQIQRYNQQKNKQKAKQTKLHHFVTQWKKRKDLLEDTILQQQRDENWMEEDVNNDNEIISWEKMQREQKELAKKMLQTEQVEIYEMDSELNYLCIVKRRKLDIHSEELRSEVLSRYTKKITWKQAFLAYHLLQMNKSNDITLT